MAVCKPTADRRAPLLERRPGVGAVFEPLAARAAGH
jgi:hypothetical protein